MPKGRGSNKAPRAEALQVTAWRLNKARRPAELAECQHVYRGGLEPDEEAELAELTFRWARLNADKQALATRLKAKAELIEAQRLAAGNAL